MPSQVSQVAGAGCGAGAIPPDPALGRPEAAALAVTAAPEGRNWGRAGLKAWVLRALDAALECRPAGRQGRPLARKEAILDVPQALITDPRASNFCGRFPEPRPLKKGHEPPAAHAGFLQL